MVFSFVVHVIVVSPQRRYKLINSFTVQYVSVPLVSTDLSLLSAFSLSLRRKGKGGSRSAGAESIHSCCGGGFEARDSHCQRWFGYCNGTFEYEGVGEPKEGKQNVWVKVDEVGGKPSLYRGE